MEKRPELTKHLSAKDFKDFYWYKEELVNFCRTENLDKKGGKIELAKRIEYYLTTGKRKRPIKKLPRTSSTFDWNKETLSLETIITDNYKNTENIRTFFRKQIGPTFKFNVRFMNWMKTSNGKTLKEAVEKWIDISEIKKSNKSPQVIAPQFEYNTYIRDFLKDNPTKSRNDAIEYWKVKKSIRGNNKYTKADLKLISN